MAKVIMEPKLGKAHSENIGGRPPTRPKCSGIIKIISVIEDEEIVKKIFKHLGLWDRKTRPPPKATGPPQVKEYSIDYSMFQLPCFPDLVPEESGSDNLSRASRSNEWLYVDPEHPEPIAA